ncbi:NAF1-domain-containing protein [Mycena maculata]|uniref:H/ACA ribonucleoprotein complex non-core subunit NAF1 n=1 Tax=Mycena maculata TaxID=230809 RepID=A0AAD7NCF7_9AGAR|nr:NAF1-domain-containing protein [Mycena maculata]
MSFLVSNAVSQDLLLIRDIIGVPEHVPQKPAPKIEDDISSSDSENGSEDEIEADLVKVEDEDPKLKAISAPTDSTSESESSDSDSSDSDDEEPSKMSVRDLDADDDGDSGVVTSVATYVQTRNEVVETDIVIPDIDEVGPDEILERVGEIMSIMDKIVIVKGAPRDVASRASDHALDCDTLLVFEDRKVLGYIYETFGPTSQPLYQVKFSATYPIIEDRVQLSCPVFHVPQRSNFVSVNQIQRFKGSDASNMHDEEPADDELEFSDDEAEAAYKSGLKRKRESRTNFVSTSRGSTPSPALMRDQDLAFMERNPYDDHSPYDDNFGSGPSRPPPIPYDHPYSDEYNNVLPESLDPAPVVRPTPLSRSNSEDYDGFAGRTRGRGRGRGSGFERSEGRGRGRGRERQRGERGKGGHGRGNNDRPARHEARPAPRMEPYDHHQPRPLSPTSMAIARATGQLPDGSDFTPQPLSAPNTSTAPWGYDPAQQFNFGYQQPFVQPHINPRFASAFMNFDFQHPQSSQPYYQPPPSSSSWTDEWTVHSGNDSSTNNNS